MASSKGPDIFAEYGPKLSPEELQQKENEYRRRIHADYEQRQRGLQELIKDNATLPVTISSVSVLNARNTRRGFLQRLFDPILSAHAAEPYSLEQAQQLVLSRVEKLGRFGIYHTPISVFFDRPDPTDPSTTPTDLSVFVSVRELSRVILSSGTWAGSNDGSVYANLQLRNIFGGAESLNANASYGTRTKSAYSAFLDTPFLSNPDLRFEVNGLVSSTAKSWASHDEALKGGSAKLKWMTSQGHRHELSYGSMWRQITRLANGASRTTRGDAGDSVKSSITHTWVNDQRDNPLLPTSGYMNKTITELAGLGPLKGDVAFGKLEFESQAALPIPLPFLGRRSGVSLTLGLQGGFIAPLPLDGSSHPSPSRINDRFFLGGPTDVRGFRFAGLGPRDGPDATGGDVYAAGGASLLIPFPRVGKDKPIRLQAFINGGRLLALQDPAIFTPTTSSERGGDSSLNGETRSAASQIQPVVKAVQATVAELADELPSCAAGIGIVYAMPVARFELNFTLPLVVRKGEEARKGVSVGVGLNFL